MTDERPPSEGGAWTALHEDVHQHLLRQLRGIDPQAASEEETKADVYRRREVARSAARILSVKVEDVKPD